MTDPFTGFTPTPLDYVERGVATGAQMVAPDIPDDEFHRYYAHDYAQRYARISADRAKRQATAPDPVEEQRRLLREDYEARLMSDSPENAVVRYLADGFGVDQSALQSAVARGDVDETRRISDRMRQFTSDNRQEIARWRRQELLDMKDPMAVRLYVNADALLTESWMAEQASPQQKGQSSGAGMSARTLLDQDTPEAVQFGVKSAARKFGLLDDRQAAMVADRSNPLYPVFQAIVQNYDAAAKVVESGNVDLKVTKARDDARSALDTYTRFATRFTDNEPGLGDFVRNAYSTFGADITEGQLSQWYDLFSTRTSDTSAGTWFTQLKSVVNGSVPGSVETVQDETGARRRQFVPSRNFDPGSMMSLALSAMQKIARDSGGVPDPQRLAVPLRDAAARAAAVQNTMDRDLASMGMPNAVSDAVAASLSGSPGGSDLDRMWTAARRSAAAMGAMLADDGSVAQVPGAVSADPLLTPIFLRAMTRMSVGEDGASVSDQTARQLASLSGMDEAEIRPVVDEVLVRLNEAAKNGAGPTIQEVLAQVGGFAVHRNTNPAIPERPRENYPVVNPATGMPIVGSGDFMPLADNDCGASSMDAGRRESARKNYPDTAPVSGTEYYRDFLRRIADGKLSATPELRKATATLAKTVGEEIRRQELGKSEHQRNVVKNTPEMNKAAGEALLYVMEQPRGDDGSGGLGLADLPETTREYIRSGAMLDLLGVKPGAWRSDVYKTFDEDKARKAVADLAAQVQGAIDSGMVAPDDMAFARKATFLFELVQTGARRGVDLTDNIGRRRPDGVLVYENNPARALVQRSHPKKTYGGESVGIKSYADREAMELSLKRLLQTTGVRVKPDVDIFQSSYSPVYAAGVGMPDTHKVSGGTGSREKGLDYSGLVWNLDIMLCGKPKTIVEASPTQGRDRDGQAAGPAQPADVQKTALGLLAKLSFGDSSVQAMMAPVLTSYIRQFPNKDAALAAYADMLALARDKLVRGGPVALQQFAAREAGAETVFFTRPIADPGNPQVVIDVPDFVRTYSHADREQLARELSTADQRHGTYTVGEMRKRSPDAARLYAAYWMSRQRRQGASDVTNTNAED